jgi:predicted RNase H-like nuclease (RuvC/YqgF family)
VQGLDKTKLLSTASEYLRILEKDAANFDSTVDAALHEKVHAKQKEIEERNARIQQLTKEISEHQQQIAVLNSEIKENVEKIQNNSGGYKAESEKMKSSIASDIEKIKQFI